MTGPAAAPLVVTAADEAYAREALQLVRSLERHAPSSACLVFDLGLSARRRRQLADMPEVRVLPFDFDATPSCWALRPRLHNTNGWKPRAIELAMATQLSDVVLWLDSATVLTGRLDPIVDQVRRHGFYAPYGGASSIAEKTDAATLSAYALTESERGARMRASGVVGFAAHDAAARAILAAWAAGCADEARLVPPGATLAHHRFDQSVLNCVLAVHRRTHPLLLSDDALDISSSTPLGCLRSRNKVHARIPLGLDPIVRGYYYARRVADVSLWKLRERRARRP